MTNDLHARLARAVRSAGEAMVSDVEAAVGRRRDWHLTVADFGKSLPSDWNDEVSALREELDKTLEARLTSLTAEVHSTTVDANAEWASVPRDQFSLRDLSGFEAVWGNRLLRSGVGIGAVVAVLGAAALIGGPAGIGIAVIGSPIASVALGPLMGLVDRIFLGKDGVLRKRRTEVAKQVGPILDDLAKSYDKAISAHLDGIRDSLARERARSNEHSASLDHLSSCWMHHTEELRASIRELDRETTSALLRIERRERLARSVKRATRVPGVCILVELESSAFWEAWLFPPDLGERLAGGKSRVTGSEAAAALSYTLGLVDAPVSLLRVSSTSATLRIDAPIPPAIIETWSDALTAHIGKPIHIEATGRPGNE